jgi:hypothetical protein
MGRAARPLLRQIGPQTRHRRGGLAQFVEELQAANDRWIAGHDP